MNIFILHKNPKISAKYHSDQHVRKMILETAQLLSFAHYRHYSRAKLGKIYKDSKSHTNHPCAKWVRESWANYNYLCKLGLALCREYTFRFGKVLILKTEIGEKHRGNRGNPLYREVLINNIQDIGSGVLVYYL